MLAIGMKVSLAFQFKQHEVWLAVDMLKVWMEGVREREKWLGSWEWGMGERGKEGKREGGKEGRREGGKEERREGSSERWREGGRKEGKKKREGRRKGRELSISYLLRGVAILTNLTRSGEQSSGRRGSSSDSSTNNKIV